MLRAAPAIFCGAHLRNDPRFPFQGEAPSSFVWPVGGRPGRAEAYWTCGTLLSALGRGCAVASGRSEGQDGFVETVRRLVAAGADNIVAKVITRAKYDKVGRVPLTRMANGELNLSAGGISTAFWMLFNANMYELADRDGCFLLQEERPLRHEYRIVVVGGRPVAGAGCVEFLSPIFHTIDDPFDTLVEGKRNDRCLADMPLVVARYRHFAQRLCEDLEKDPNGHLFTDCVMDVALDIERNEVVLVEVNPADNFGLYAMDWREVFTAILARSS